MTEQAQSPHGADDGSPEMQCRPSTLALHLASEHADADSMYRAYAGGGNGDFHHREHTGPGTIRDHDEDDLSYDLKKVSAVLRGAEEEDPPAFTPDEAETFQEDPEGPRCAEDLSRLEGRLREELFPFGPGQRQMMSPPPAMGKSNALAPFLGRDRFGPVLTPEEGKQAYERYQAAWAKMEDAVGERTVITADLKGGDVEIITEETRAAERLALHLSSAHHDDQAWFRTRAGNEIAHRAILPHRHAAVQERYERALSDKIESDEGDGTMLGYSPVPHPPYAVADLARIIGDMHRQDPDLDPALMAVDLAWIKTATWPWHRRVLAAILLAFSGSRSPSWHLGRNSRQSAG